MSKLFHVAITILLSSTVLALQAQQDSFRKEYLERFENSRKYLVLVAESMPDSNYSFRPTPAEMTFAEQLMHIALAMDWHAQSLIGDRKESVRYDYYKVENRSKEDVINVLNKTFEEAVNVMNKFDPANYEKRLDYNGLSRTKRQIFLLLSDHVTHHRAQLLVYIRLKNILPPKYIEFQ